MRLEKKKKSLTILGSYLHGSDEIVPTGSGYREEVSGNPMTRQSD